MEKSQPKFLYEEIVEKIKNQISSGVLRTGDQLPSIRKLSKDLSVSMSTIIQSYIMLEGLGLVESKPQSGYYVRFRQGKVLPEIEVHNPKAVVSKYTGLQLASQVHELAKIPNIVSLGSGLPGLDILPVKSINRIIKNLSKNLETTGLMYEFPPGDYNLRREIAKNSIEWGCSFTPEEIIITTGAIEAIAISLKVLAKPGDTIVVESPSYYVIFQLIESLGMKALEIPTHPRDGIDIKSLRDALKTHKIAACLLYPTMNNPLGSVMPEDSRKELYELLSSKNIPLIEANIYGELCFNNSRPKPIKAIDKKGIVLYIASLSKTIAPGYRIGWICPGKYFEKIKHFKFTNTLATPTLPQAAMAEFLKSSEYERTLRNLRRVYDSRISVLSGYIAEYFPEGTKIAKPQGGFYLWVELPEQIDSIKLFEQVLKENISIAPGPIFSTKKEYSNYIRLSCACPWTPSIIEGAIKKIGDICKQ